MNSIIIKKRLDSNVIKLGAEAKPLLGKEVEITIKELTSPRTKEKKMEALRKC